MNAAMNSSAGTVPFSRFNEGLAGAIFREVRQQGMKVVERDGEMECVLLSPEAYAEMLERLEDAQLLSLALERAKKDDPAKSVSLEELCERYGITEERLAETEEVAFE